MAIMIEQSATATTATQQAAACRDVFHAAATLATRCDFGTLLLDGRGRIVSSGTSGGQIFGASQSQLQGRSISAFIASLFHGEGSRAQRRRHLGRLSATPGWRRFAAVDVAGRHFAILLSLTRIETEGEEMFLLNLRRPATVVSH